MIPIESEKITLVLLPGLNGTAGLFDPLLSVATKEYELMVISYPTHKVKSYEELTKYVSEEIASINGRYILVGESFSGPIVIALSARNITGLIGTVLVATFVTAPYLTVAKYLPWTLIFKLARMVYWASSKLSNTKNKSLFNAVCIELQNVKPQVLAARIRAALTVDVRNQLQQNKVSMVYFRARYDVVVPIWNLKKILNIKPDMPIITFNTNHFLLQSSPQTAWEAIDKFVKNQSLVTK